jgi:hypothetical protein
MNEIPFWQYSMNRLILILADGSCGGEASSIEAGRLLVEANVAEDKIHNGDENLLHSALSRLQRRYDIPEGGE